MRYCTVRKRLQSFLTIGRGSEYPEGPQQASQVGPREPHEIQQGQVP